MASAKTLESSHEPVPELQTKGAAKTIECKGKAKVTDDCTLEVCTICLDPITERAIAFPCNHLSFDFICLVSWLQEQPKCPLCKTDVIEVQYDWSSPEDYKTYTVKPHEDEERKPAVASQTRAITTRRGLPYHHRNIPSDSARHRPHTSIAVMAGLDPALDRRRAVYRNQQFSSRVGTNRISQYREITPQVFAASPSMQSRARTFLRRELQVFTFLDTNPRRGNREFLIEYVATLLRTQELKGANGVIEDVVAEMLGRDHARLLLHELEAWLRSPYETLSAWDAHVQYTDPRHECVRER